MDDEIPQKTNKITVEKISEKLSRQQVMTLIKREKALKLEVANSLGNADQTNVADKIVTIEQLQKVIEWQRKSYLSIVIMYGLMSLIILVVLTLIPSHSLSLTTPGYIDVTANTVNITLAEDLSWSGESAISSNSKIAITNFKALISETYPQINHTFSKSYAQVNSSGGGNLTSLFIPKGSKIWLSYDLDNNMLKIDISSDSIERINKIESQLTFTLFGDLTVGPSATNLETFEQRHCPAKYAPCRIPRIVSFRGHGEDVLSIEIPINGRFELNGIGAKRLSFSDFTVSASAIGQLNCAIGSGNFQLSSHKKPIVLSNGDCLSALSETNRFSVVSSVSSPLKIGFYGGISSLLLGTPEFNNEQTPNLLNWALAIPGVHQIGALFASIIAVIGIIITTIGIKK